MNYIRITVFSLCVIFAGCAPKLYPEGGDSAELNNHKEQVAEEVTIDEGTVQRKSSNNSLSNATVDTTLTEINLQGVR